MPCPDQPRAPPTAAPDAAPRRRHRRRTAQRRPGTHGETAAEFDTLARTAKHLMNWVLRELGPVLTTLPVGPSHPGRTAGPTFDIARPAIFLLPPQDAAWKIIKERLDALQQACATLGQQAGLGALVPLAEKLQSMSQDIGRHGLSTGG